MNNNFMENINGTTIIDEHGVIAMTAHLMMEVAIRSFLMWCFEEYGMQMIFKHSDKVFKVVAVDELGYVTGVNEEEKEVYLHPREAIMKLPKKAFLFFKDNWLED